MARGLAPNDDVALQLRPGPTPAGCRVAVDEPDRVVEQRRIDVDRVGLLLEVAELSVVSTSCDRRQPAGHPLDDHELLGGRWGSRPAPSS